MDLVPEVHTLAHDDFFSFMLSVVRPRKSALPDQLRLDEAWQQRAYIFDLQL
jgi:hypothetical protein